MSNTPTVEQTILMDVEKALREINPTVYVRSQIFYTRHNDARSIEFTVMFVNEFSFAVYPAPPEEVTRPPVICVWKNNDKFPTKTVVKEIKVHNLFDYEQIVKDAVRMFMPIISFSGEGGHIVKEIAAAMQNSMDNEDSDGEFTDSCYKFSLPENFNPHILNQIM